MFDLSEVLFKSNSEENVKFVRVKAIFFSENIISFINFQGKKFCMSACLNLAFGEKKIVSLLRKESIKVKEIYNPGHKKGQTFTIFENKTAVTTGKTSIYLKIRQPIVLAQLSGQLRLRILGNQKIEMKMSKLSIWQPITQACT